jgi:hypothetical protein
MKKIPRTGSPLWRMLGIAVELACASRKEMPKLVLNETVADTIGNRIPCKEGA